MHSIKLEFFGANENVTGSKTLVEFHHQKYLVDCGLFQGAKPERQKNWDDFPIDPKDLQAVFLTHAHLDHIGYLPRLYRQGFRGPIYCSEGTAELAQIILLDAAFLEEELAGYARKTGYSHYEDPQPLFNVKDAENVLKLLHPIARQRWCHIAPGLDMRLLRAGHIIGASIVQLRFSNDVTGKVISFSGGVGHNRSLILKGPDLLQETDVLILESTYGNRLHPQGTGSSLLQKFLAKTIERGGVAIIPAFAVGRSQDIIYTVGALEREGLIPSVPVILDSPMASKALQIFFAREEDQIIASNFRKDPKAFFPRHFEIAETADQSMAACMRDGPAIIISASGMLSGGRVLHHLKRRLPDPRNTLIFAGYQAEGTKGRFLQDNVPGLKTLRIHHQEVEVEAEIATIEHLSSHADYSELLSWMQNSTIHPEQVILNHGTPEAQSFFADEIKRVLGWKATPAVSKKKWDILF